LIIARSCRGLFDQPGAIEALRRAISYRITDANRAQSVRHRHQPRPSLKGRRTPRSRLRLPPAVRIIWGGCDCWHGKVLRPQGSVDGPPLRPGDVCDGESLTRLKEPPIKDPTIGLQRDGNQTKALRCRILCPGCHRPFTRRCQSSRAHDRSLGLQASGYGRQAYGRIEGRVAVPSGFNRARSKSPADDNLVVRLNRDGHDGRLPSGSDE